MIKRDGKFWEKQISSAKDEAKAYLKSCKDIADKHSDGKQFINLLYSNTETLAATLYNNNPKPEVCRRFFNSLESEKKKSELFAIASRVSQSAIEFYIGEASINDKARDAVRNLVKFGRGILWLSYEPKIVKIRRDLNLMQKIGAALGLADEFEEKVGERNIRIDSLAPEDYLCSWAQNPADIVWKARRRLMSEESLRERFGYSPDKSELNYDNDNDRKETQSSLAEVWEVWDKIDRARLYVMPSKLGDKILKKTEDPYGLPEFFPVVDEDFINKPNSVVPVPEYNVWKGLDDELQGLAQKNKRLEQKVRYLVLCLNKNSDTALKIENAADGDIISLEQFDQDIKNLAITLDVSAAISMIDRNVIRIAEIKREIWEITGIADIMRGSSDPRETAEAQKIKGLFGGFRFKMRQEKVQSCICKMFKIIAELICEHWDWETLQQISCIELPDNLQKQAQIAQAQISGAPPPDEDKPTSDEVMALLRDDKMRNFMISIESTATAFDDLQAQATSIAKLTDVVTSSLQVANQTQNPDDIEVMIPLAKMNMSTIKIASSISNALIDNLQKKAESLRKAKEQPPAPPQPSPDMLAKLQLEREKMQSDQAIELEKLTIERAKIALKEQEIAAEHEANAIRVQMGISPDTNIG